MTGPIQGDSEAELQKLCAGLNDQQLAELAALAEAMHAESEGRSRFSDLEAKLAAHGARNPAGLARYIGMKKYGKAGFAALAKAGRKAHGRSYDTEGGLAMVAVERRFTSARVELRAGVDQPRIGGYAAKFNTRSHNLGGFVETVAPPFFERSKGNGWPDVMCRYNHDDNQLLGTTAARTLGLRVDSVGLEYEVDPPKAAGYVTELVQRGDVTKSSFAFRVPTGGDEWSVDPDTGYPMRSLVSGILVDVAPVNSPAYVDTSTALRSLSSGAETQQMAEMRRLNLGPEAALRSLALRMSADFGEVVALAEADELRKFFVRTDNRGVPVVKPKPGLFGPAAAAALLARKQDPYL